MLPSVRDRMESLCRALPTNGFHKEEALRIFHEINRPNDEIVVLSFLESAEEGISERFRAAFQSQQMLLRSHRLHASLLSSVISGNPSHSALQHQQHGEDTFIAPLDWYICDVLCASYLISHAEASLVEGGPTESAWMDKILSERQQRAQQAFFCYHAWTYLHSSLLRIAPFTLGQQRQLGISSLVAEGDRQHLPFSCGRRNHVKQVQVWNSLGNLQPLRTTLNDFGRLGPTFRGRDLIQSRTVFAPSCLDVTREFVGMHGDFSTMSPFLRSWRAGEESVITWLLFMHREAGKARPMTVSPPVVAVKASPDV